jgi:hypothetical protein
MRVGGLLGLRARAGPSHTVHLHTYAYMCRHTFKSNDKYAIKSTSSLSMPPPGAQCVNLKLEVGMSPVGSPVEPKASWSKTHVSVIGAGSSPTC